MTVTIGRRELLVALGGAAAAWPLAARAQQAAKTPRVGYIRAGTPNNDQVREEFVRGMRDLGYVEGRNITCEFRYYGDDIESIPSLLTLKSGYARSGRTLVLGSRPSTIARMWAAIQRFLTEHPARTAHRAFAPENAGSPPPLVLGMIFGPKADGTSVIEFKTLHAGSSEFLHLLSPLAHRGCRVIGTDKLRLSLVLRISSHGEKREQNSEDNPNVNAHLLNQAASRCVGKMEGCRRCDKSRPVPATGVPGLSFNSASRRLRR
jgi:hypothetical protein